MDNHNLLSRLIYSIIMMIIYTFLKPLIILVAILQYLHVAVKKTTHPLLLSFGHSLAQYTYEIIAYVTVNSEQVPYPFAPWPK
jgi:hypothetical protein